MPKVIITFISAYLIGSISFAVILSKIAGKDVRTMGSGNAGSTNMLRSFGKKWALLTFAGDFLKGSAGIYLAGLINAGDPNLELIKEATVIFLLLGHMKPVFFSFRGGKGVATGLGSLVMVAPKLFAVLFICGIAIVAVSGYVSLAAISMASLYPFAVAFLIISGGRPYNVPYILVAFVIAFMILFSHKANIKRLLKHEENSIYKKRRQNRG